jgi:hypothetical protein
LIDVATKRVNPKQKKAKIKAYLDEFRDQIKGKYDGQDVEYAGELKTYLTQNKPTIHPIGISARPLCNLVIIMNI